MNSRNLHFKKTLAKKESVLASSLILVITLACRYFTVPELFHTPSPTPVPGVDELRFSDAETGQRFRSLNSYINNFIDETWRTTSYRMLGNFYQSIWCHGADVGQECQSIYSTIGVRDRHIIELYTLFYNDFPEVTGLGFSARWLPKETGWGASFYFSEGGSSTVGEGWGVDFNEYTSPTGRSAAAVSLGNDYRYKIIETFIEYAADLSVREDLALYLAGPEAMRDRGLIQIQALAEKVRTEIGAHRVPGCDYQLSQEGPLPPLCISRPMTPAEEAVELARVDMYFGEQEQLLQDHYPEMYTAWMTAFPLDQYWP